ncbi:MAG: guanylate kinase [Alphaproteobacteria bacterium]|jgi:guanylate kinase|nr:guanylate kinase [Rickettsiales bacterium]
MTTSIEEPRRRGVMFVLSSPSGAGKTTLSRRLLESDLGVEMSISVTTRPMRPGESEGRDYYFISEDHFKTMVSAGDLLEHAMVFDHYYGTPRKHVSNALAAGKDVLFDIDWQGTRQLAERCREDLVSVFILPPSLKELERRLRQRAQDSEAVVLKRMARATDEISHWQEYDYVIVNDDLDEALVLIKQILEAERLKRTRQPFLEPFVAALCGRR